MRDLKMNKLVFGEPLTPMSVVSSKAPISILSSFIFHESILETYPECRNTSCPLFC